MRYDEDTIMKVREANDIVDVVGRHVRLTKRGANYFGLCPFHGEKTPSFSVNADKQIYHCFGCGAGGNVISFVMNYENQSFTEALRSLALRANIELPEPQYDENAGKRKDLRESLFKINTDAALFYHNCLKSTDGKAGLDYFIGKRGLTGKTLTHFGLGITPRASDGLYRHLRDTGYTDDIIMESGLVVYKETNIRDRFFNRVIFPIMDASGHVIGFGGRVMGEALPKYLNSPETLIFDKSNALYGLNFAKKSKAREIILCEGYLDVISLHQAGFDNAVACLGTALTAKHARLLKRYTSNIILAQDSDEAGIRAKIRAFPILHDAGLNVKIPIMEDAKDPDEFVRKKGRLAYEEIIGNSRNAFLYIISEIKKQYDLSDPAEKTLFYKDAAERLCMFREPLERANYTESVSREFFIPSDELKALVEQTFMKSSRNTGVNAGIAPDSGSPASGNSGYDRPVGIPASKYEEFVASLVCSRPDLTDIVLKYIGTDEFTSPVIRDMLSAMSEPGRFDPQKFLIKYNSDEKAEAEIASILAGGDVSPGQEDLSSSDIEKGLTEAVRAIKSASIDKQIAVSGEDVKKLHELFREKNGLRNLKISISDEIIAET